MQANHIIYGVVQKQDKKCNEMFQINIHNLQPSFTALADFALLLKYVQRVNDITEILTTTDTSTLDGK